MAKKKKVAEATPKAETNDIATSIEPAPALRRGGKRKASPQSKPADRPQGSVPTLADLAKGYLESLEDAGKSEGTVFSYRLELQAALAELGAVTLLRDLTPTRVLEYFVSDKVMKTRSGKQKAIPTYAKTRRVLRLALTWAEKAGLIEKAPLPEEVATH